MVKGVLPLLPFLNSGKQGKCICTCVFLRKSACWGPPPIPRQGPLAPPCQTLHRWSGYAPLQVLNTRDLTGWKEVCSQRPSGRVASPLGVLKKAAGGGSFTEFRFQYPISVSQECIYSCPACHDCFRWNWYSCHAWKQPRHETGFSITPGLSCARIETPFRGFR